ncbi:hypothetical protein TcWFU_001248 [Taenia crassiceps]|uniref:Uncharacterized protein n=1 Tax=Taenia crassiceps TaxID=6207 RepID=A0ABR4Q2Z2_9CEST
MCEFPYCTQMAESVRRSNELGLNRQCSSDRHPLPARQRAVLEVASECGQMLRASSYTLSVSRSFVCHHGSLAGLLCPDVRSGVDRLDHHFEVACARCMG